MTVFRLVHVGGDLLIFFFFSSLLVLLAIGQRSEAACTKKMLKVKPANGSHLVLSGIGILKDYYEKECLGAIDKLTATVQAGHYRSNKKFELDIDNSGNAFIPINPCFACEIFVTATDQNGNTNKTKKFHYNRRKNDRYPYSNQLREEVIDKVCLMSNGKIKFPSPPTSIKSCVFFQDEQLIPKEQGNKHMHFSGNVTFTMIDPASESHPRNVCIQAYIDQIEDCSEVAAKIHHRAEDTIAELPFWEVDMSTCNGFDIIDEKNDTTNVLVIGLSVVVGLLLVALVAPLIHKRRKDVKQREDSARAEVNPMYGDYYRGGRERERTMEILNQNSVYGTSVEWGDGGVVKDNNPYYDTTA